MQQQQNVKRDEEKISQQDVETPSKKAKTTITAYNEYSLDKDNSSQLGTLQTENDYL